METLNNHNSDININKTGRNASFRKWRLIVRNLSFEVTQKLLQTTFSKYGEIQELVMPEKKGRFAGFCFLQFKTYDEAASAMKALNGQMMKNRTIAIDWAMPKDQYMTAVIEEKQKDKEVDVKPEPSNQDDVINNESTSASDEDTDEDDSDSDDEEEHKKNISQNQSIKPPRVSDVGEGRTLFIRGLPYDLNNEELKEAFEKFGALKYALICRFSDSDMSKGSGFVQFLQKADSDRCLDQANNTVGIVLKGRRLNLCVAIDRKEVTKVAEKRKLEANPEKQPDKRNLHLLRIGLLRQGTNDEADMSKPDASKRLKIEAANRAKIKNANIFVSATRLVVHNVPVRLDDKQLRQLCLNAVADKAARVQECRIMRDMENKDANGQARSRGFAFVEFQQHEHAMACLKQMNNNPEIFTNEKRPIVEFSLENRLALNAKALRLEKSKESLKRNREKQNDVKFASNTFAEPAQKRRKMLFKPQIVPRPANAPKNPFPSHMGPKIRSKQRTQMGRKKSGTAGQKKK